MPSADSVSLGCQPGDSCVKSPPENVLLGLRISLLSLDAHPRSGLCRRCRPPGPGPGPGPGRGSDLPGSSRATRRRARGEGSRSMRPRALGARRPGGRGSRQAPFMAELGRARRRGLWPESPPPTEGSCAHITAPLLAERTPSRSQEVATTPECPGRAWVGSGERGACRKGEEGAKQTPAT